MRLRHIKGCEQIIESSNICLHPKIINNNYEKLDIGRIFDNNNPLYIELGMGKGKFICESACANKNINYIGIEKSASIILKAFTNYNTYKTPNSLSNLYFLCINIEKLPEILVDNSITKIFLNFSDPWPKKKHEHRRLTSEFFIKIYKKLLINDGIIELKTDNKDFFDYSLEQFRLNQLDIVSFTYDLHNDDTMNTDNIMTEYEEKFSKKGNPICKFIAKKIS